MAAGSGERVRRVSETGMTARGRQATRRPRAPTSAAANILTTHGVAFLYLPRPVPILFP